MKILPELHASEIGPWVARRWNAWWCFAPCNNFLNLVISCLRIFIQFIFSFFQIFWTQFCFETFLGCQCTRNPRSSTGLSLSMILCYYNGQPVPISSRSCQVVFYIFKTKYALFYLFNYVSSMQRPNRKFTWGQILNVCKTSRWTWVSLVTDSDILFHSKDFLK